MSSSIGGPIIEILDARRQPELRALMGDDVLSRPPAAVGVPWSCHGPPGRIPISDSGGILSWVFSCFRHIAGVIIRCNGGSYIVGTE
jgi:hypothetical protein